MWPAVLQAAVLAAVASLSPAVDVSVNCGIIPNCARRFSVGGVPTGLAVSADGGFACTTYSGPHYKNKLFLWNTANAAGQTIDVGLKTTALAFSPSGGRLAVLESTTTLAIYSQINEAFTSPQNVVRSEVTVNMKWNHEVRFKTEDEIYVTSPTGVSLVSITTNTVVQEYTGITSAQSIDVSSNGRFLGAMSNTAVVRVWEVATTNVYGHNFAVTASDCVYLRFFPDGTHFIAATSGAQGVLKKVTTVPMTVWEDVSISHPWSPYGYGASVSDNGLYFAASLEDYHTYAVLYSADSLSPSLFLAEDIYYQSLVTAVSFMPGSAALMTCTSDMVCNLFSLPPLDVSAGTAVPTTSTPASIHKVSPTARNNVQMSCNGWQYCVSKAFFGTSSTISAAHHAGVSLLLMTFIDSMFVWNATSGYIRTVEYATIDHGTSTTDGVTHVVIPDSDPGEIRFYDAASLILFRAVPIPKGSFGGGIVYAPDSSYVLYTAAAGVVVMNANTFATTTFSDATLAVSSLVAVSPDSQYVACGGTCVSCNDGSAVVVWKVSDGSTYAAFSAPGADIKGVFLYRDTSSVLLTFVDKLVKYSVLTGRPQQQVLVPYVASTAMSSDGALIAVSTSDVLMIYSGDDFSVLVASLVGHANSIRSVTFGGGHRLFSCSTDDTCIQWDLSALVASDTTAPLTALPTTESPATAAPKTDPPATNAPTTDAPTTEAPKTDPPATDAPKTDPPATGVPKTDPPTTNAPTTDAPTTEAPKTESPATGAPKTNTPATDAPTDAPMTESPATEAPKTDPPATNVPTTDAPTTEAPKTDTPATGAPKTEPPTTNAPKVVPPVTATPKTELPTTSVPATEPPRTGVPSTDPPATEAPKTELSATGVPVLDPTEPPTTTEPPATEPPHTITPTTITGATELPATVQKVSASPTTLTTSPTHTTLDTTDTPVSAAPVDGEVPQGSDGVAVGVVLSVVLVLLVCCLALSVWWWCRRRDKSQNTHEANTLQQLDNGAFSALLLPESDATDQDEMQDAVDEDASTHTPFSALHSAVTHTKSNAHHEVTLLQSEGMTIPSEIPSGPHVEGPTKHIYSTFARDKKIGCGAFAVVFVGRLEATGAVIAMKEQSAATREDANETKHTLNLLQTLRHPKLIAMFDMLYDPVGSILCVFMEYVPGGSLGEKVRSLAPKTLPEDEAATYTRHTLSAIEFLHSHNIVHRDIKSDNILLTGTGDAKLCDFGTLKELDGDRSNFAHKTQKSFFGSITNMSAGLNTQAGSPNFMAPELLKQGCSAGTPVDIYSLGCAVSEMLNGGVPPGKIEDNVWAAMMRDPVHPPENVVDTCSSEAKDFVLSCLAQHPNERPTATALLQHIFIVNSPGTDYFTIPDSPGLKRADAVWLTEEEMGSASKIRPPIGKGSYGVVHRAMSGGREVAVKEMILGSSHSAKARMRVEQEFVLMRSLRHPHVVQYLGHIWRDASTLEIYMEYMPGGSIKTLLRNQGSLDAATIRAYTKQILLGLAYLHSAEVGRAAVAHRDVKADNVLISAKGSLKLSDFGCSKLFEDDEMTHGVLGAETCVGTPFWMAPEVLRKGNVGRAYGTRCDIWSLGCTVVEMSGVLPWRIRKGEPSHETVLRILDSEAGPPLPPLLSSDPQAQRFLDRCFVRDPTLRPNATTLLQDPYLESIQPSSNPVFEPLL